MDITSEQTNPSLAQRIAKVRNCMLVELSTGVSPTDKDLFASLCQTYEQNSLETACTANASSQNALHQACSFLTPESALRYGAVALSDKDTSPGQYRVGFSMIRWSNLADWDDWKDWYDR